MCQNMYVCVYIYIYMYIHTHTHMHSSGRATPWNLLQLFPVKGPYSCGPETHNL